MEFDLSIPDIAMIAKILAVQSGISDCDPDDPCDCPCNCLRIDSVSITVDNTVLKTRSGYHVIRARKKRRDSTGHKPRFQCANCEYATDSQGSLDDIEDAADRIASDDLMGAGQCPECGALVFDTCGRNYTAIHSSSSDAT